MKRYIIITVAAALCAMLAIVFISARPVNDTYAAQQHLKQLGWKTGDIPDETETVVINADSAQYIKMQEEYGYDLKPYLGKPLLRCTFRIKNYPESGAVYANVLIYEGKAVGGDIMTRALDGFMKGLYSKDGTNR